MMTCLRSILEFSIFLDRSIETLLPLRLRKEKVWKNNNVGKHPLGIAPSSFSVFGID